MLFLRSILIAFIVLSSLGPASSATFTLLSKGNSASDDLIIFVHGIGGDQTTFGNWPSLLKSDTDKQDIGPAMQHYAIATILYDSKYGNNATAQSLAIDIRNELCSRAFRDKKRIYIITHSLGGLLLKSALVDIAQDSKCKQEIQERLKALLFFAVPSDGSSLADVAGPLARRIANFGKVLRDLQSISENGWLEKLAKDWSGLTKARTYSDFRIYCGYERDATTFLRFFSAHVVPEERVDRNCDDDLRGFDRDHFTIVKPDGVDDVYRWAAKWIVDSQRPRGRTIVAMDSVPNAYSSTMRREGISNAVVYQDQLEKLKTEDHIDIEIERETTHRTWDKQSSIFRRDLALIILHLSAFEFEYQKCWPKKIGMACSGNILLPFLKTALRKQVPIILYSRVDLCTKENASQFLNEYKKAGGGEAERLHFVRFDGPASRPKRDYMKSSEWNRLRATAKDVLSDAKRTTYEDKNACKLLEMAAASGNR